MVPTNVFDSGKLNGLVDINFACICIWEITDHVQLKRKLQNNEFWDNFLNLMVAEKHDDFQESLL